MKMLYNQEGCFNSKRPFLFLILCTLLLNACSTEQNDPDEQILFSVNDIEMNVFDFEQKYIRHLINTGRNDTREERYAYLNQWIDELLLAQDAADSGFTANEAYQRGIRIHKQKTMTDVYFVDEMNERLDAPTEEELRLAFAKKKRKVYVRHLYARKPEDLVVPYEQLKQGDDFVDVANRFYNTAEYDSLAGYLGHISYFGADDKFAETAYSLNQGEFSEPIRTRYGYHIVYVDYITFPAILAEDEFQARIEGTTSQLRLRQQSLSGNDYVYELMSGLDVKVNSPQILKLREKIQALADDQPELRPEATRRGGEEIWTDSKANRLGVDFENDVVLATYTLNGENKEFTFQDYQEWLAYLPFAESKTNTGASIGRALRNEVFYELAEEAGYEENDFVEKQVQKKGYDLLSSLRMNDLIAKAIQDTQSVNVPSDFRDRLIRNPEMILVADYWFVPVSGSQEALKLKNRINSGEVQPESLKGYAVFKKQRVSEWEPNYSLLRDALLDQPLAAFSGQEGWLVLNVQEREILRGDEQSLTKVDVQNRYKAFQAVNERIKTLREQADIEIDTALFDELYELEQAKAEKRKAAQ